MYIWVYKSFNHIELLQSAISQVLRSRSYVAKVFRYHRNYYYIIIKIEALYRAPYSCWYYVEITASTKDPKSEKRNYSETG